MFNPTPHGKAPVTIYGRRNWERLVLLSTREATDVQARKTLADALAALVSEVTPAHREVIASDYLTQGAAGRMHTHPLPPGLAEGDRAAQERWAALVFLDCVDRVADVLANDHGLVERQGWRACAEAYTQGAERYGRTDG